MEAKKSSSVKPTVQIKPTDAEDSVRSAERQMVFVVLSVQNLSKKGQNFRIEHLKKKKNYTIKNYRLSDAIPEPKC